MATTWSRSQLAIAQVATRRPWTCSLTPLRCPNPRHRCWPSLPFLRLASRHLLRALFLSQLHPLAVPSPRCKCPSLAFPVTMRARLFLRLFPIAAFLPPNRQSGLLLNRCLSSLLLPSPRSQFLVNHRANLFLSVSSRAPLRPSFLGHVPSSFLTMLVLLMRITTRVPLTVPLIFPRKVLISFSTGDDVVAPPPGTTGPRMPSLPCSLVSFLMSFAVIAKVEGQTPPIWKPYRKDDGSPLIRPRNKSLGKIAINADQNLSSSTEDLLVEILFPLCVSYNSYQSLNLVSGWWSRASQGDL